MNIRLPLLLVLSLSIAYAQPSWKRKMNDYNVNFYDVVREAETYFETHGKGEGSGWKGFQRWKAENESRFYPTGDRSQVDPYFAEKAYQAFMNTAATEGTAFDDGWRDLGPYDANNVTSHYSPGIGRVESFWVNPNDDQHIYMGSRSGGFWRTTDGGATWINTTDYLVASGVNTIAVNPFNSDSICINVRNGGNSTSHGIYRSTDGGLTWTLSNFSPANVGWGGLGSSARIFKIAYHPTIAGLVFIGTSDGLYRSDDDLATWTQHISPGSITDIDFHPTNPNMVYVYDDNFFGSNQSVVMISNDMGQTFNQSGTLNGNNDATCYVSTSPDCPDCIYVGSSNGIWKSTNGGTNFTLLTTPNQSCWGFSVSDLNDDFIVYGGVDLERSTNGGNSFNQTTWWSLNNGNTTPQNYVHADLRTAEAVNGVFYVGTDGYLAKSTDNGVTWTRLNDGTGIRENYAVGISQSNWLLHMSGSQDNGTSIMNENGWIEWNGGDGMEAVIQTLNDDWMMGSWQYGTRNRTKDGGQTRSGVGTPESGSGSAYWVAPMFYDPNQQMRVYHFSSNLFKSEEFGTGWELVGTPGIGIIQVATIAENNSDLIIAIRNSAVMLSQDGGATWNSIAAGLPGHAVTDVAFDPRRDSTIVVTFNRFQNDGQKVYISHDLGVTWSNITFNLGDMPLRTIVIDHTPDRNIYVGGEIGVFYKPLNGNTWTAYNNGLANVTVRDLEIQYGANAIKAATWGRGLWDYTLVGRKDYPAILKTNITDPPTEEQPFLGNDQTVTSVISYDGTLSSVFVKWGINGKPLNNTIQMTNTMDSTWVSNSGIPGDLPNWSDVFFKVYAVGSNNDTTETYKYMYRLRGYCPSSASTDFFTAITQVEFGDIQRFSGKDDAFNDYTQTDSAIVVLGESYDLTIGTNTNNFQSLFSKAWIDWNRDGDFDDNGEEYNPGNVIGQSGGPTSNSPLTIHVPSNAVPGKTTMRISVRTNGVPNACDSGFDGEVEDYAILITECAEVSLSATTFSLTASLENAAYQWMDCNTNTIIVGANDRTFIPSQNGSYAVITNTGTCLDTSACFVMDAVGIYDNTFETAIKVYPNPSSGEFAIDMGAVYRNVELEIMDLAGKVFMNKSFDNLEIAHVSISEPAGIYLARIRADGKNAVFKLIKE